jgi:hypothetical protein
VRITILISINIPKIGIRKLFFGTMVSGVLETNFI